MNTLIYSELLGSFQSFVDINPKHYIEIEGKLFFITENGLVYQHSSGKGLLATNCNLSLVVNQDFPYTKVFDNIEMYSGFGNAIEVNAEFNTASQFSVLTNSGLDNRESTYLAAIPRDSTDGVTRMRDKFLLCNYNIKGVNSDRAFSIPYIKTKYRYSLI